MSPSERGNFYRDCIDEWIPDRTSSILIIAGGGTDRGVMRALGFTDVTITNLDPRMKGDEFAPFKWRFEDGNSLTLPDESVDYAIVHAGLHHMPSPHRGLTEMYRVARKGVAVFEARDSATMRLLEKLGLTQSYEHSAVYDEIGYGGVNNGMIPNYIYRWTEREIEKTIASYAPAYRHVFRYRYHATLPTTPVGFARRLLIILARPFFALFQALFPRQRNLFAAFIEKPPRGDALQPWVKVADGREEFDLDWGNRKYGRIFKPGSNPSRGTAAKKG